MEKKIINRLTRINRILVWPTLILVIVYVFSGYGMTNPALIGELSGGALNRTASIYLHTTLTVPVLLLLLIHILIGMRSALTRAGVKEGTLLDAFLVLLAVFSIVLLVLLETLKS